MDDDYDIIATLGKGSFGIAYLCQSKRHQFEVLKIPKGFHHHKAEIYHGCAQDMPPTVNKSHARENKRIIHHEKKIIRGLQGIEGVPAISRPGTNHEIYTYYDSNFTFDQFISGMRDPSFELGGESLLRYAWSCVSVCEDVAKTIYDSQQKGLLIHADLKPDNVVIIPKDSRVRARVIDYSCALMKGMFESLKRIMLPNCHNYVPPDLLLGKRNRQRPNEKTDVFSIGMMLHTALTPKTPIYDNAMLLLPGIFTPYIALDCGRQIDELLVEMVRPNIDKRLDVASAYEGLSALRKDLESRVELEDFNTITIRKLL